MKNLQPLTAPVVTTAVGIAHFGLPKPKLVQVVGAMQIFGY